MGFQKKEEEKKLGSSIEQNPRWDASVHMFIQEISRLLWSEKILYHSKKALLTTYYPDTNEFSPYILVLFL
jgi:hypothetical protein